MAAANVEVQILAINLGKIIGSRFESIQKVFIDALDCNWVICTVISVTITCNIISTFDWIVTIVRCRANSLLLVLTLRQGTVAVKLTTHTFFAGFNHADICAPAQVTRIVFAWLVIWTFADVSLAVGAEGVDFVAVLIVADFDSLDTIIPVGIIDILWVDFFTAAGPGARSTFRRRTG